MDLNKSKALNIISHNKGFNKKIILLLTFGVLFVFSYYALLRYAQSPWNRQFIANYLYSVRSTDSKFLEGSNNCNCPSFFIKTGKKTLDNYDQIVNSMLSFRIKVKRMLHILFNYPDPYLETILPRMQYSPATVEYDNTRHKAKIKLTGGQVDHFDSERRSLRIKLKYTTIFGMSKFNIYNPKARLGGIYEWIGHELMKYSGLIPLGTGYVNVSINNNNKGIYFYQEQPTIQMLINNKKYPGLLVRISHTTSNNQNQMKVVNLYDEKSFPSKELFNDQHEILKNKFSDYNSSKIGIEQVVSIPKLAKYSAVVDLINGYHGAASHNNYYYLNPVDSLLEPIGREFTTNYYLPRWGKIFKYEENQFVKSKVLFMQTKFNLDSVASIVFQRYYYAHLQKISETEYLDHFMNQIDDELRERQFCLYKSSPNFKSFSKEHYYDNQIMIKEYLNEIQYLQSQTTEN